MQQRVVQRPEQCRTSAVKVLPQGFFLLMAHIHTKPACTALRCLPNAATAHTPAYLPARTHGPTTSAQQTPYCPCCSSNLLCCVCHAPPVPPHMPCQVPVALVTRNTRASVEAFLRLIGPEWAALFSQVLTREFRYVKPDRRLLLHVAQVGAAGPRVWRAVMAYVKYDEFVCFGSSAQCGWVRW